MRPQDTFPCKEPVPWTCAWCGAGLLRPPADAAGRRYCSRECVYAAHRAALAAGQVMGPPGHTSARGSEARARSLANLDHSGAQARILWEERGYRWCVCYECGEEFATRAHPLPFYCSATCRQCAMYRQRAYVIGKECPMCQQTFVTDKYRPKTTCSRSCAKRLWWQQQRETGAGKDQSP